MFDVLGKWTTATKHQCGDRAVQFGDGCFTTLAVEQGKPILLSAHLKRLQRGCDALFLPSPDWQWLASHLLQIASTITEKVLLR